MYYKGQTVWITGASSGIGEAMSKAFFKEGANLILSSRREEVLQDVKKTLGGDQNRVYVLALDLTDPDSFDEKTQEALNAFAEFLNSIDINLAYVPSALFVVRFARLEFLYVLADRGYRPGQFMTGHLGQSNVRIVAHPAMPVAAAYTRRLHADDRAAARRRRVIDVTDLDGPAKRLENRCFH